MVRTSTLRLHFKPSTGFDQQLMGAYESGQPAAGVVFDSPQDVVYSPDIHKLAVADAGNGRVMEWHFRLASQVVFR